jgi:hypothetical protein
VIPERRGRWDAGRPGPINRLNSVPITTVVFAFVLSDFGRTARTIA